MGHISKETLRAIDKEIMRLIDAGEMTKETLSYLDALADIKKDTLEACMMEDQMESGMYDEGNSYGGYRSYNNGNGNGGSYYGGSYAPRRNMRGQYSRDGERDAIYSRIEQMMDSAQNESERDMVRRILNSI